MGYIVASTTGYRSSERVAVFEPTRRVSDIPVIYAHGGGGTYAQFVEGAGVGWLPAEMADRGFVGLAADLGGVSPWGNADMCGPGTNATDQLLAWSATNHGTRTDQVAIVGLSHGASELNWAWRNPDAVAAVALILPGVDMQGLYERNPLGVVQAQMHVAYGDSAGVIAAYPTRDPSHPDNVALQRPLADRMAIWYGLDDVIALPAEAAAWANAVRVPSDQQHPMVGVGHDFDFDWDPIADWLFETVYYGQT